MNFYSISVANTSDELVGPRARRRVAREDACRQIVRLDVRARRAGTGRLEIDLESTLEFQKARETLLDGKKIVRVAVELADSTTRNVNDLHLQDAQALDVVQVAHRHAL